MSNQQEVMKKLTEIQVSSARIEEKVEGLADKVELAMRLSKEADERTNKRIDKVVETIEEHDIRIRGNEKRSAIFGAVGGGAAGIGITLIAAYLKAKI